MRFLVIRLSSFGDIILTTPVLEEIKKKYPDAKIDFVVMDKFKDAIIGNKNIDRIIVLERDVHKGITGIKKFCSTMEKEYDYIVDIHSKLRSRIISFFIKGKVLRYKKRAIWKSILVNLGIIKYSVDDTIVKSYFKPLKKLGIEYSGENLEFNFSEEDLNFVKEYSGAVIFAPGASKETKKWPAIYFAELGKKLKDERIVVIGGKSEFEELEYIKKEIGNNCENFAGKLSLKQSGALLAKSKYIVTNDSGPFHIARGVNCPAFVIFGPTDPNMFKYEKKERLIYAGEKCSPCSLHGDKICPKGHFNCMKKITPEMIYQKIKEEF